VPMGRANQAMGRASSLGCLGPHTVGRSREVGERGRWLRVADDGQWGNNKAAEVQYATPAFGADQTRECRRFPSACEMGGRLGRAARNVCGSGWSRPWAPESSTFSFSPTIRLTLSAGFRVYLRQGRCPLRCRLRIASLTAKTTPSSGRVI